MSTALRVGIDLGTTFSCVAALDDRSHPVIVPSSRGEQTTPSVLWFDGHEAVVGACAYDRERERPGYLADFVKRNAGKPAQIPPELYDRDDAPPTAPYARAGYQVGRRGNAGAAAARAPPGRARALPPHRAARRRRPRRRGAPGGGGDGARLLPRHRARADAAGGRGGGPPRARHHQRAHSRGARLPRGLARQKARLRLRPRRRHLRRDADGPRTPTAAPRCSRPRATPSSAARTGTT